MTEAAEPLRGPGLWVLFTSAVPAEPMLLRTALRGFDRRLREATLEVAVDDEAGVLAVARFGDHVVDLSGRREPLASEEVAACLMHAHYDAAAKSEARAHGAHVGLTYAGASTDPVARFAALCTVAGALGSVGGRFVLHPRARTSVPASLLARVGPASLDHLDEIPWPLLFVGFGKYEADDGGVWMRTHAASLIGLPDLALRATDHEAAAEAVDLFDTVLRQLVAERTVLSPGAVIEVDEQPYDVSLAETAFAGEDAFVLTPRPVSPQPRTAD